MSFHPKRRAGRRAAVLCWFAAGLLVTGQVEASNLDTIGVVLLRTVTTNLDGAGVRVAQAEGEVDTNQPPTFEVNPNAVGQPVALFTYTSSLGSSSTWTNTVGAESWHADQVGWNFYSAAAGVATNILHVENYEAGYFYNSIIASVVTSGINDPVVNQSFIFYPFTIPNQQSIDSNYDDYAAKFNTLFVSGAGNGGGVPVCPPSTCYNGLCVGAYVAPANYSSVGPTLDNGRCKPDLTAPEYYTSYSTPLVAGGAAVLLQAALRGDGGSPTNYAADIRTLKALLLNGAIKPSGWTNSEASPLDLRYGAGVMNVYNSYVQLTGGRNTNIASVTVVTNAAHPPTGATGTVARLSGWDFATLSSSNAWDRVNHYYFNVTNGDPDAEFVATATLAWNRQQTQSAINDLDLFLYDAVSSNLVACSTSLVDNVEHLFVPHLPPGRYDLQVLKNGGLTSGGRRVTTTDSYALAFEFFSPTLGISPADTNALVSWPIYPAGFVLETTVSLDDPLAWTNNATVPVITNKLNQVGVEDSIGNQFFRLRRP
jgi:hypothetical protein